MGFGNLFVIIFILYIIYIISKNLKYSKDDVILSTDGDKLYINKVEDNYYNKDILKENIIKYKVFRMSEKNYNKLVKIYNNDKSKVRCDFDFYDNLINDINKSFF